MCKINTFDAISRLHLYFWLWLGLAVIAFIALLIDIIENDDPNTEGPLLVKIAQNIVSKGQLPRYQAFGTLLYVMTTFFLLLSLFQFIAGRYLAIICTVNSSKRVATFVRYVAYATVICMSLSVIFTIGYLINLPAACVVAVFIHVLWMAAVFVLIYKTVTQSNKVSVEIVVFHDFLISYRQTPRSKILRRHLPQMEAVVEEASQFE